MGSDILLHGPVHILDAIIRGDDVNTVFHGLEQCVEDGKFPPGRTGFSFVCTDVRVSSPLGNGHLSVSPYYPILPWGYESDRNQTLFSVKIFRNVTVIWIHYTKGFVKKKGINGKRFMEPPTFINSGID